MDTDKSQDASKAKGPSPRAGAAGAKKKPGAWHPEAEEGELEDTALESTREKLADREQRIRLSKGHVAEPDEQSWPQSDRRSPRERGED